MKRMHAASTLPGAPGITRHSRQARARVTPVRLGDFHDREGFTVRADSKVFAIMKTRPGWARPIAGSGPTGPVPQGAARIRVSRPDLDARGARVNSRDTGDQPPGPAK